MELLEQTIALLSVEERKDFKSFLNLSGKPRKDIKLFSLLCQGKEWKQDDLLQKLYPDGNSNAYHSLRKRLLSQLTTFVELERSKQDTSDAKRIEGWISMASFFVEKSEPEAAFRFLLKAQQTAEKNNEWSLLDRILILQLRYAQAFGVQVEEVIEKWEINKARLDLQEKLWVAQSLIRSRLQLARKAGTMLDLDEITKNVLTEFNITSNTANDAQFMYALADMMRSAVVSSKDYSRFEPFILRLFNGLEKVNAFGPRDEGAKLGFLYMIAHVMYRLRKLDEAHTWLERMKLQLSTASAENWQVLYPKFILLSAALNSYSGHNEKAVAVMEEALKSKRMKMPLEQRLNMQLNLSVYCFQAENYKQAQKTLAGIHHTDTWLEKKMGQEWRFKKSMIELIIYCELGHDDLALSRIRSLERHFSEFFQHPAYQRARMFLRFIREVVLHPERVTTEAFSKEIDEASMALPDRKEDIQAITFYCWLKAKMVGRKYYDVLLEAMRHRNTTV